MIKYDKTFFKNFKMNIIIISPYIEITEKAKIAKVCVNENCENNEYLSSKFCPDCGTKFEEINLDDTKVFFSSNGMIKNNEKFDIDFRILFEKYLEEFNEHNEIDLNYYHSCISGISYYYHQTKYYNEKLRELLGIKHNDDVFPNLSNSEIYVKNFEEKYKKFLEYLTTKEIKYIIRYGIKIEKDE